MQTFLEKLKSIYQKVEGLPHDRIVPTVGLNIGRIEDTNVKLVFWDLGGQVWFLMLSVFWTRSLINKVLHCPFSTQHLFHFYILVRMIPNLS
jgi:hypothetical protein